MGFVDRVLKVFNGRNPQIAFPNTDIIVSDLDAGRSGDAGTVDIFPSTAASGKLALTAADNTSDVTTTVVNAAQEAARTYTIPDSGAAATFMTSAGGRVLANVATPQTATDTATLSDAQIIGGILVGTPTSAATYTTRTGTQLEAALGTAVADQSFDLIIINLGSAGDIITLAGGTGVTIVGSATVDDAGADINSSGIFRFRRSASNTFIAYRIS